MWHHHCLPPFRSTLFLQQNRFLWAENECCGSFLYHSAPNVYTHEKMIDDCFDALKSINTMEREALARTYFRRNVRMSCKLLRIKYFPLKWDLKSELGIGSLPNTGRSMIDRTLLRHLRTRHLNDHALMLCLFFSSFLQLRMEICEKKVMVINGITTHRYV